MLNLEFVASENKLFACWYRENNNQFPHSQVANFIFKLNQLIICFGG